MDMTRPSFANPQPGEPERLLQRAIAHSTGLRRAFHTSAALRRDAEKWKLLEDAAATVLELNSEIPKQQDNAQDWFAEADEKLKASVVTLLGEGAPKTSRISHYRRAASQVYGSAAAWGETLDEATLAYWRHAALVWMTLWHIADVPDLTAEQAKDCLNSAFREASLQSVLKLVPKKGVRSRLSDAANAVAAAFRKGA